MKNKGNKMILLESVGTYLDTNNGMTYPAYIDNKPDMENGHPINDIEEDEWMLSLSEEDFDVPKVQPKTNYFYALSEFKNIDTLLYGFGPDKYFSIDLVTDTIIYLINNPQLYTESILDSLILDDIVIFLPLVIESPLSYE